MRISDWSSDVCSSDRNASATLDAVAGAPAVGSEPVGTMELDFHGVDEFWSRRPESWRHAVDAISGRETWISSDPSEALKARLTALGEGFSCNASELSSWSQRPGWLAALRAQIGRAHVGTPVTNAHPVCRCLLEIKKQ